MFTIVTDHLPLVKVLIGSLENLSPKLFRCVTDMLDFNYKVIWTPGKSHMFVDSLGRIPQLESFKDWDPLSDGEETDWENGGQFGIHQSVHNVTHLDQQSRPSDNSNSDGRSGRRCFVPKGFTRSGCEEQARTAGASQGSSCSSSEAGLGFTGQDQDAKWRGDDDTGLKRDCSSQLERGRRCWRHCTLLILEWPKCVLLRGISSTSLT